MHLRTHKNKPVKNFGSFDSFKFDGRKRKNNAVNHQKTAYGGEGFALVVWRSRGDSEHSIKRGSAT